MYSLKQVQKKSSEECPFAANLTSSVFASGLVFIFLVHMCKTVTSSGEILICRCLSTAHCVHAAAMGGLWDLRLPMTNGGQAGAAES